MANRLLILTVCMLSGGCTQMTSMTGARTLGARGMMVFGTAGAFGFEDSDLVGDPAAPIGYMRQDAWGGPAFELGLRTGVTDRLDMGGRVYPFGVSWDSGIQLLRSNALDLALAPTLSMQVLMEPDNAETHGIAFTVATNVPLLIGVNIGRSHQLVVGGIARGELENPGTQKQGYGLFAGGSLAWAWWAGDHLFFQPEVVALWPAHGNTLGQFPSRRYHAGLGFGGRWEVGQ